MTDEQRQKAKTIIGSALAGIIATLVGYLVVDRIQQAEWKGKVDSIIGSEEKLASDVTTALTVLGDHGTEFHLMRTQLETVRTEMAATRNELLRAISDKSSDRFTLSDWEREQKIIDLRFKRVEEVLGEIRARLEKLQKE